MPSSLPTPVAAVIGIVPTLAHRAGRVPGKVLQLPLLVISRALTTVEVVQRDYDELAERGESFVRRLRGQAEQAWDETEDRVEHASDRFTARAQQATRSIAEQTRQAVETVVPVQTPEAERAKGRATPTAVEPDTTRVDTAVSAQIETVVEATVAPLVGQVPDHDDLPLPDYDHMTLGSLRGRLRSLSLTQLGQTRAYEKTHADRLPVVTMLDNRIAKLAAEPSAAPTVAPSTAPSPEQQAAGRPGGSKVSPSTAVMPSGPATNSAPARPLN